MVDISVLRVNHDQTVRDCVNQMQDTSAKQSVIIGKIWD